MFAYDPSGVLVTYGESATWEYHVAEGVQPLAASAFANVTTATVFAPVAFRSEVSSGIGPHGYLWSFGDGGSSHEANPIHTYLKPGEYNITLEVTDATGASAVASLRVSVVGLATSLNWILIGVAASIVLIAGAGVGVWWRLRLRRARDEEGLA